MADVLSFALAVLTGSEVAVDHVDAYQRTVGTTAWGAVVDTVTIASLPADPDTAGNKLWSSALLDPAKETLLVPVAASGQPRPDGVIIPAQPSEPETFTVYAYTVDAGLGVVAGVSLVGQPVTRQVVSAGAKVVVKSSTGISDADGYAAVSLPADAGTFQVMLAGVKKTIATAGRSGQVVNWGSLPS